MKSSFHEPINIRAENIARIDAHAASLGVRWRTEVFASRESWRSYALDSLRTVERLANELGLGDRLHLWPGRTLGSQSVVRRMSEPERYREWLNRYWTWVSE